MAISISIRFGGEDIGLRRAADTSSVSEKITHF